MIRRPIRQVLDRSARRTAGNRQGVIVSRNRDGSWTVALKPRGTEVLAISRTPSAAYRTGARVMLASTSASGNDRGAALSITGLAPAEP